MSAEMLSGRRKRDYEAEWPPRPAFGSESVGHSSTPAGPFRSARPPLTSHRVRRAVRSRKHAVFS
jgi:hypothetical protein